jgi:hypothetical protein
MELFRYAMLQHFMRGFFAEDLAQFKINFETHE